MAAPLPPSLPLSPHAALPLPPVDALTNARALDAWIDAVSAILANQEVGDADEYTPA